MIKNNFFDMLARLRNASLKNHNFVVTTYTKLNFSILKTLINENIISNFSVICLNNKKYLKINLKYSGFWLKTAIIIKIKACSKSHKPEFLSLNTIKTILRLKSLKGKLLIVSTVSGIMNIENAFKLNLGGKLLCIFN